MIMLAFLRYLPKVVTFLFLLDRLVPAFASASRRLTFAIRLPAVAAIVYTSDSFINYCGWSS